MSTENPYAAGEASFAAAAIEDTVELLPEPIGAGAGASIDWIKAGFADFHHGAWSHIGFLVLLSVAFIVFSGASNLGFLVDPVFGFVVNVSASFGIYLLTYVILAGFLVTLRSARESGEVRFENFFSGFQHPRLGALIGLGALYLAVMTAISIVALAIAMLFIGPQELFDLLVVNMDPFSDTQPALTGSLDHATLLTLTVAGAALLVILVAVLAMLFFFAGHLVTFTDATVFEAMKLSFLGCLRNILPLFVWSLVALVLTILGALPCMLGLLVVVPALWASSYQAFLDIFTAERAR
jgi:uncharacterized membrane protein